jgi:hypothetical protein
MGLLWKRGVQTVSQEVHGPCLIRQTVPSGSSIRARGLLIRPRYHLESIGA